MKINIMFLLLGLLLSITSKILQYFNNAKLGNILVIPAAILLVLALMFSLPKINALLQKDNGLQQVILLSICACVAVVSFQLMMMLLIGQGQKLALLLIIPIVCSAGAFIYKWLSL